MQAERLVPIGVVAYELGWGTTQLERRCNGAIQLDELGLRCVSGRLVRELLADRNHELDAQRQRRAQERAEQQQRREQAQAAQRAREARAAAQRNLVAQGLSAHETMLLAAGEFERKAAQSPTGDYLAGTLEYRPIREKGQ